MDSIDRLKLAIYESGLDDEDQEALLDYVESVIYERDDNRSEKTIGSHLKGKYIDAVSTAGMVGGVGIAGGGIYDAGSAGTKLAKNQIRKQKLKKEIEEINAALKGDVTPNKAVSLAAKLAKNKAEIAQIDAKNKNLKAKLAVAGLQTAGGAGLAGASGLANWVNYKEN